MTQPNRNALITGGSGGIGIACATMLIARGYDVTLVARREDALREAAARTGARWLVADTADPQSCRTAFAGFESIDLLVHAAGVIGGTYMRKQTFEQWRTILAANLDSCFVVTQAALPLMTAGSRFVFISSSAAHDALPARTAYGASKAGMNAFAQALAREVDRDGISVHVVSPGPVETPMLQDVPNTMYAITAEDVADAVSWLDTVASSVELPEIRLDAVTRGPLSRPPVQPLDERKRAQAR